MWEVHILRVLRDCLEQVDEDSCTLNPVWVILGVSGQKLRFGRAEPILQTGLAECMSTVGQAMGSG
jgi:hypothetical protein